MDEIQNNEIDLLFQDGRKLIAVEVKSNATGSLALVKNIEKIKNLIEEISQSYLIYAGADKQLASGIQALNFKETARIF